MIYKTVTIFLKNRTIELMGLVLISIALLLAISFFSYSPNDPTFIYGPKTTTINNLLGIYGGLVADFLLQSFGLASFLILITIISWGTHLIIKKEIKKIYFKVFYLILYLLFVCILIHTTFNNSFWLIDNGNSGFVGQILYSWAINIFPFLNHEYTVFVFLALSIIFFVLASNINFKYFWLTIKNVFKLFKKNNNVTNQSEAIEEQTEGFIDQDHTTDKAQQIFPFENVSDIKQSIVKHDGFKNFKLPSVDLLEKNPSKINLPNQSKNRSVGKFIEQILLDFGIEGKITKINNGPLVNLYEF